MDPLVTDQAFGTPPTFGNPTVQAVLFGVVILGPVILAVISIVAKRNKDDFFHGHQQIETANDIESFKVLARSEMHYALVAIGLGAAGIISVVALCVMAPTQTVTAWAQNATMPAKALHVALVVGPSILLNLVLVLPFGLANRGVEKRVQSLSVSDPELAAQYQRVVESWRKKALPDF